MEEDGARSGAKGWCVPYELEGETMRQIIDPNMRKLIQAEIDKTLEMRYVDGELRFFLDCPWHGELNAEKYCHFLVPEACPYKERSLGVRSTGPVAQKLNSKISGSLSSNE
jgi:hypothetical protein